MAGSFLHFHPHMIGVHDGPTSQKQRELNPPSPVIHFRNVGADVQEYDLVKLAEPFGAIVNVLILRSKNQGFIQFVHLSSAQSFISAYTTFPPRVRNTSIYPGFSNHQSLTVTTQEPTQKQPQNRILRVTISNVLFPITVETISTLFSPYESSDRGTVEKIVLFQNNHGLHALVQFSSTACATQAMTALNGRNIFTNCCTMTIQFSDQQELTVHQNNAHSWDFFVEPQIHIQNPQVPTHLSSPPLFSSPGMHRLPSQSFPPNMGEQTQNPIIIVGNYPSEKFSVDHLFNIFSNYGFIYRIKTLANKPNTVFIEFSDPYNAQQAVTNLRGIKLFGKSLVCDIARIRSISMSNDPHDTSIRDYSNSQSNRYQAHSNVARKSHYPPTWVIHVSNLTENVTNESLVNHLTPAATPQGCRVYTVNGKTMALVQMRSVEEAVWTLAEMHNSSLDGSIIKISFTKNTL
ncbi:putative Polypyrimidine tract-binding protein [Blattamonas nauphoetae]|uniref:Polypyrimidine tract-binding protein n=1 Tax=Blattamonas nauphoetae TaxID=2049346 RepID=A0ABQ9YLB3_9EUKA|nr:putative Polypyrimidine tract-binding protein [Blattamonas nauphoetae]